MSRKLTRTKKKTYSRVNRERDNSICSYKSISNDRRWTAWKSALNIHRYFIPGKYSLLKLGKKSCQDINNDVSRTFTNFPYNKKALENILATYATYNESVGYCQGMNYLAGILLIVSDSNEEETFWAFVSLMERKISTDKVNLGGLCQLYQNNFPLVKVIQRLFEQILKMNNPLLDQHLNKVGLSIELWLQKWISSLFLYSFPMDYSVKFWDALMINGISFLLPLSLVIVRRLAKKLMEVRTIEKCYEILKIPEHVRKTILPNPDLLVEEAKYLKIDWKELEITVDCESSIEIPTNDCYQANKKQMLFSDLCFLRDKWKENGVEEKVVCAVRNVQYKNNNV